MMHYLIHNAIGVCLKVCFEVLHTIPKLETYISTLLPSKFIEMTVFIGFLVLPQNVDIMTLYAYIDV